MFDWQIRSADCSCAAFMKHGCHVSAKPGSDLGSTSKRSSLSCAMNTRRLVDSTLHPTFNNYTQSRKPKSLQSKRLNPRTPTPNLNPWALESCKPLFSPKSSPPSRAAGPAVDWYISVLFPGRNGVAPYLRQLCACTSKAASGFGRSVLGLKGYGSKAQGIKLRSSVFGSGFMGFWWFESLGFEGF